MLFSWPLRLRKICHYNNESKPLDSPVISPHEIRQGIVSTGKWKLHPPGSNFNNSAKLQWLGGA